MYIMYPRNPPFFELQSQLICKWIGICPILSHNFALVKKLFDFIREFAVLDFIPDDLQLVMILWLHFLLLFVDLQSKHTKSTISIFDFPLNMFFNQFYVNYKTPQIGLLHHLTYISFNFCMLSCMLRLRASFDASCSKRTSFAYTSIKIYETMHTSSACWRSSRLDLSSPRRVYRSIIVFITN